MTAPCFGQEIGHNFGLEPGGSPHFQDPNDPGHSNDAHINDVYAFDFVNMRPFNPPPANHFLGDVMNNLGAGAWQGRDLVLFNAYDWEYLRGQFVLLNSTGTEINPAYTYVCGPHAQPKVVPPATWVKVITGQADGPLITWGPHGIHVGPPPRPDRRLASVSIDGLLMVLGELRKQKVGAAYLPYADQPFPIVGSTQVTTFHHADFNFGGVADKRR